jgi:pyruvate formate lyase activating enzyme
VEAPEIKGFIENSFVDWPGKLASVVFLPGCNYRCPYCHNHRLVLHPCAFGTWSLDAVLGRLERLRGWVDGVCVTGGEPTVHTGTRSLLTCFKTAGWAVKLDTNGSRPDALGDLLESGLVDEVAIDVKAPLEPISYRRNAGPGGEPERVRASLEVLARSGRPVHVRTTVHPFLLSREELVRLAGQVGGLLAGRAGGAPVRYVAQRCRVDDPLDPSLREQPTLTPEAFAEWAGDAEASFRAALAGSTASSGVCEGLRSEISLFESGKPQA